MNTLPITLADYQKGASSAADYQFGGSSSYQELQQLNKALEAGEITGRETTDSTTASGAPLKVESLEKTMKHLTFKRDHCVFWKNIPKKAAFNTVEEYYQQSSYGTQRGGFYTEGELPREEDSVYTRRAQLVKFMGITKSVTHPMQLVSTALGTGKMVERAIEDGTLWLLRQLDTALYFGDEQVVPQQFNGILSQHRQSDTWSDLNSYYGGENVIDARGAALGEAMIQDAANSVISGFGIADQLYAPPVVISDFVESFYGNKFIQPNTPALTDGVMGQKVRKFASQFGDIDLNWDLFFNKLPFKKNNAQATAVEAPPAPTTLTATPVASDASGKWAAGDAGNYYYAVTALNTFGESALTITASAATIVAGGSVDLDFGAGTGINPTSGYRIYRSNKGAASAAAATFYPLFDISVAQLTAGYDGASAGDARDRNRILPDTNQAFIVQHDTEVLEFAQLAPLMKMDLAILSPAYRFMILLYGTPFLYAPKKLTRIINIGRP